MQHPCPFPPLPAIHTLRLSRDSSWLGFSRECSQHWVGQEEVENPHGEQEGLSMNWEEGAWGLQLCVLHVSDGMEWDGWDGWMDRWMGGWIGWMDWMNG